MRILVTGVKGQLGYDVARVLTLRGHEPIAVDIDDMDITDAGAVEAFFDKTSPEAVIHCAAYTATEKAEDEPQICARVNVDGTENLAKACRKRDLKMLYISTDYVFDGHGDEAFRTTDKAAPLSVYGRTKYEGEVALKAELEKFFIVRISWVFGINGKNFVRTMLRIGPQNGKVSAVNDQIGSPTYTADLAVLLADMIVTDKYGVYHATNEGYCTWYDFAREIFSLSGLDVDVSPVGTDHFPSRVQRPLNSRLDKSSLDEAGFERLPHWKDALSRYIDELNAQND